MNLFIFTFFRNRSLPSRYLCFGSGAKRNSIMTTLDATLEFIRKGITDTDRETPMTISPGSSPSSSMMQESANSLLDAAECIEGPSPKNMTSEEGNLMIDCLQRWRGEVERETESKYCLLAVSFGLLAITVTLLLLFRSCFLCDILKKRKNRLNLYLYKDNRIW